MKTNQRGIAGRHSWFGPGRAVVIVQVALSLVLVTGAVLMAGTFRNLTSADMGFDRDHVLLVPADLSDNRGSAERLYAAAGKTFVSD